MNVDGFIIACSRNKVDTVERMIMKYPTIVNQPNACGFTGLMSAADHNNISVMKILLSIDYVDISLSDNIGWTALHFCCRNNSAESMKLLLKHPRSSPKFVSIKDINGNTAENIASEFRYTKLVQLIQQYLNATITLNASPNTASAHTQSTSLAIEPTNVLASSTSSPIPSTSSTNLASQKNTGESAFQITIEEIKEAEKELKSQEEELETVAKLLSKHQQELEMINNEINNQLLKNREELVTLYQKATHRT